MLSTCPVAMSGLITCFSPFMSRWSTFLPTVAESPTVTPFIVFGMLGKRPPVVASKGTTPSRASSVDSDNSTQLGSEGDYPTAGFGVNLIDSPGDTARSRVLAISSSRAAGSQLRQWK